MSSCLGKSERSVIAILRKPSPCERLWFKYAVWAQAMYNWSLFNGCSNDGIVI